ncbi:MAG: beta-galactosidase, partial [Spirochaetes bacterium]|nr:beta-galactosidase [Spirochaetota bacterium]
MHKLHNGVKFGVAYYPEQWDRSLWKSDLARIRAMGADEVRLMEFSWSLLEPRKGEYDFSIFDEVLEICE